MDALYRRPQRGEVTGAVYNPAANIEQTKVKAAADKEFSVRTLPGEGNFNEKIAAWYQALERKLAAETRKKNLLKQLSTRENTLQANIESLTARQAEFSLCERWRELGELLKNNLYKIEAHAQWVSVEDYFHDNQTIEIELNPRLDAAQNDEQYFKRFKKEKAGLSRLNADLAQLAAELKEVQAGLAALQAGTDGENPAAESAEMLPAVSAGRVPRDHTSSELPGLVFQSGSFRLIVGRKSEENDQLLRRYVKGNDYWLHTRDYPGAYVFITTDKGKSVPLDVMLDAANLALLYSKGKKSGQGDIYYTQVKYLRRAKNARLGTVLPTREKNIFVKLDLQRLHRLFNVKDGIEIPGEMHIL
jgi:predicted ribosome quality control (RQC) complex YloA/Tae2 family protein